MPSGALAKKLLVVSGLGLVALLLAGAAVGAIGSAILPGDSFLSKPEIHLPPQPIFPLATMSCCQISTIVGLLNSL